MTSYKLQLIQALKTNDKQLYVDIQEKLKDKFDGHFAFNDVTTCYTDDNVNKHKVHIRSEEIPMAQYWLKLNVISAISKNNLYGQFSRNVISNVYLQMLQNRLIDKINKIHCKWTHTFNFSTGQGSTTLCEL